MIKTVHGNMYMFSRAGLQSLFESDTLRGLVLWRPPAGSMDTPEATLGDLEVTGDLFVFLESEMPDLAAIAQQLQTPPEAGHQSTASE